MCKAMKQRGSKEGRTSFPDGALMAKRSHEGVFLRISQLCLLLSEVMEVIRGADTCPILLPDCKIP